MNDSLAQMLQSLMEDGTVFWQDLGLSPAARALVVIVLFLILARLASFVLTRVATGLTRRTRTDVDDQLVVLIQRPVFVTVLFVGLGLAVATLALPEGVARLTTRLLQTILVFVWASFGFRFSSLMLAALSRNRDRLPVVEERTIPLFDNLGKLLLIGGASYAFLLIWEINAAAWLASAGIIGIAVGFAAKDSLANLFSGVFIIADAPYSLGDFIILDSGERGQVTHVGIRSTRLLTRDDVEITIPNSVIANAKIVNESGGPWEKSRVRVKVGVAYGSDVDAVCKVLEETAATVDHVCAEPEPRVRFRAFGSSSLDFELLCWIDQPIDRGRITHLLHMEVYKAFRREKIEIPFPQQDVYVRQLPERLSREDKDSAAG